MTRTLPDSPEPANDDGDPRPLPRLHRAAPGLYYGWFVIAGAGLLGFACVGIGFYGQVVFVDSLVQTRGWSRTQVAGASSLYFVVAGLAGPLVGRLVDRYGPGGVVAIGALIMAGGLCWIGRVATRPEMYAAFAITALGFALAGSVPNNAIVTRWFVVLRARAMSISQTGVSLGGILLVPFSVWLIGRVGFDGATLALALLLLAVALPTVRWVLARDPESHGLEPDGGAAETDNPLLSAAHQRRVWRTREVLRTRSFWLLAAAFGAILFSQMSFLIHQVALMREHMDAGSAALSVSLMAGMSVAGRFAGGVIADRVERRRFGVVLFLVQAAALALLATAETPLMLYASAALLGLTIGNVFMLQSLLVGDLFGIPSFGRVYGMLLLLTQLAGGLGPVCLGALYYRLGGYPPGLLLMTAFSLLASALLYRVRAPAA